jgi:hypothetical protein
VALAFPSGPIQKLYTCNAPWDHLFLHTLVLELVVDGPAGPALAGPIFWPKMS